jgi:hypothetical protein
VRDTHKDIILLVLVAFDLVWLELPLQLHLSVIQSFLSNIIDMHSDLQEVLFAISF